MSNKFIRFAEVERRTGFSRAWIEGKISNTNLHK